MSVCVRGSHDRKVCAPGDAAMQGPTLQHASEVVSCRRLFIRMHEGQEGLANQRVSLFSEVSLEHRVQIDKTEVGREQCPVCRKEIRSEFEVVRGEYDGMGSAIDVRSPGDETEGLTATSLADSR